MRSPILPLFFCLSLTSAPAFALGIESYLGYYDVVSQLSELEDACPLQTAKIERGNRLGVDGILLDAQGTSSTGEGGGCHTSLQLMLTLQADGIRCEDEENGVRCQSGNNQLKVKITPTDDSTLVLTARGTGAQERFLSLILKRSGRPL